MGVRANLAAITLIAGDTTQAETIGTDAKAQLTAALLKIDEITKILKELVANVLTPGSDASNITTVNTAITALN